MPSCRPVHLSLIVVALLAGGAQAQLAPVATPAAHAAAPTLASPAPSAPALVVDAETQGAIQMAAAKAAAYAHWRRELDAFAAADRDLPATGRGIVFVGSSTIRMWSRMAQDFGAPPAVLNRGFGGSTLAECSLLVNELVGRHRPRQVIVYAGDNDLAEGRKPLQVLESFARFATTLRAEVPDVRITFVSIKPSPLREKFLPQVRETNNVIGAYLNTLPNSDYVDIFTPMLGADGRPRTDLYRSDLLHMNDAGYAIWHAVIAPRLMAPLHAGAPGAAPAPAVTAPAAIGPAATPASPRAASLGPHYPQASVNPAAPAPAGTPLPAR